MPAQLSDVGFFSVLLRNALFGAAFLLLVAAWFFSKRLPDWFRSLRSASWPMAEGKVESVNVRAFAQQALGEIAYSYLAEGERHSGYFSRQFVDEGDARDYVDRLKGQPILVRYQPTAPAVSAVRLEEQGPLFLGEPQNYSARLFGQIMQYILGDLDWRALTTFSARSWPSGKGKVESVIVTRPDREGLLDFLIYVAEVSYSYGVAGEYYSGHFDHTFFRKKSAQEFAKQWEGRDVFIRHRPSSPEVSLFLISDQQGVQTAHA